MGNQEGKDTDSIGSPVDHWLDEEENDANNNNRKSKSNKNDDDSHASHSRSFSIDEGDQNDNGIIAMPRSRSINFSSEPQEESFDAENDSDGLNSLMARGAPNLAANDYSTRPLKKKYLDSLTLERVLLKDDDDNDDEEETDGLLMMGWRSKPVKKRNRKRVPKRTFLSLSFRTMVGLVVVVVFVLAMVFVATVFEKNRKSHLRGDNTNNGTLEAPSTEIVDEGPSAMTNTHVEAEESSSSSNSPTTNCQNNLFYRHENQAGKNCGWVAQAKTPERCADERILRNCPATCDPGCIEESSNGSGSGSENLSLPKDRDDHRVGTEYPTEIPTSSPTFFPTVMASYGDVEEEAVPTFFPTIMASYGDVEEESVPTGDVEEAVPTFFPTIMASFDDVDDDSQGGERL